MLHYTPSSLTGGLRKRATRTVGICVVGGYGYNVFDGHPFSEKIWAGITKEADKSDYSLLHYSSFVRNSDSCDGFLDGRVDGVLFFNENGNARLEKLISAGLPCIVTVRSCGLPEGCTSVFADEGNTVNLALNHLWELGHRRIAHLTGPCEEVPLHPDAEVSDDVAENRYRHFVTAIQERGAFDPALIASAYAWRSPSHSAITEAVARWQHLAAPPTAIFCANDRIAWIAVNIAKERKWQVPQALSIVGVDDEPDACLQEPMLTTIRVPAEEIGQKAMQALIQRIETGMPNPSENIQVPVTELIVCDSTAPPTDWRKICKPMQ